MLITSCSGHGAESLAIRMPVGGLLHMYTLRMWCRRLKVYLDIEMKLQPANVKRQACRG